MSDVLLDIENLKVYFDTPEGVVRAVDDISLTLREGQTLALVGESGCGKTTVAHSILRLHRTPPAHVDAKKIEFEGVDFQDLSPSEIRHIRGNLISMVFQEPMTALNPVLSISQQMREVYEAHTRFKSEEIDEHCIAMLKQVGVPDPEQKFNAYPHELSGGLRQRIMIAMALAMKPKLLIADEPVTALDVTIQAQLLRLMKRMGEDLNMAILLITHNFGVVSALAQEVAVMYAGKIVEMGNSDSVFYSPRHPYTIALMHSMPGLQTKPGDRLQSIPGMVPNLLRLPKGCAFSPRCNYATEICRFEQPTMECENEHLVSCFRWRELQ